MQVRQAMVADKLTAGELMCTSLAALPPVVPLRQLARTLAACSHASFPVTEDPVAAAAPGQVALALKPRDALTPMHLGSLPWISPRTPRRRQRLAR